MSKRLSETLILLALVILSLTAIPLQAAENDLTVHFIDVGQGDSALIQLPSGQTILIDGGTGQAAGKVVSYLKAQGVTKIDHLIATHPHEVHVGGLIYAMMQFPVGKVYMLFLTRLYDQYYTTLRDQIEDLYHKNEELILLTKSGGKRKKPCTMVK